MVDRTFEGIEQISAAGARDRAEYFGETGKKL